MRFSGLQCSVVCLDVIVIVPVLLLLAPIQGHTNCSDHLIHALLKFNFPQGLHYPTAEWTWGKQCTETANYPTVHLGTQWTSVCQWQWLRSAENHTNVDSLHSVQVVGLGNCHALSFSFSLSVGGQCINTLNLQPGIQFTWFIPFCWYSLILYVILLNLNKF
jgi:hypothetical protein